MRAHYQDPSPSPTNTHWAPASFTCSAASQQPRQRVRREWGHQGAGGGRPGGSRTECAPGRDTAGPHLEHPTRGEARTGAKASHRCLLGSSFPAVRLKAASGRSVPCEFGSPASCPFGSALPRSVVVTSALHPGVSRDRRLCWSPPRASGCSRPLSVDAGCSRPMPVAGTSAARLKATAMKNSIHKNSRPESVNALSQDFSSPTAHSPIIPCRDA